MGNSGDLVKISSNNTKSPPVVANLDDGYLRLANQMMSALCQVKLSDRENRLLLAVIFKTYGFNKAFDWIANMQITELTGIDKTHISKVKKGLFERHILIKDGKKIGVNPVVSDWLLSKSNSKKPVHANEKPSLNGLAKKLKQANKLPKQAKRVAQTGNHNKQNSNTINTNTINNACANKSSSKNISFEYLPDDISIETAEEFIEHRNLLKAPLTQRAFDLAMEEAAQAPSIGLTPEQAIDETIAAGWKGIKIAWLEKRTQDTGTTGKENNYIRKADTLVMDDTSWADNLGL